ncbi:hypothetical protein CCUS01_01688 [Colletotrichum cuscutae]|uniref:Uncharacterized protein n=1 Tax=Colletotrichum cuscutae TaxID=1209917 RepID=A0AAI9UHP8_9PEZI|nr:hypothetical protein CCUS01_01688 [Colletotrichum cuscutae]
MESFDWKISSISAKDSTFGKSPLATSSSSKSRISSGCTSAPSCIRRQPFSPKRLFFFSPFAFSPSTGT